MKSSQHCSSGSSHPAIISLAEGSGLATLAGGGKVRQRLMNNPLCDSQRKAPPTNPFLLPAKYVVQQNLYPQGADLYLISAAKLDRITSRALTEHTISVPVNTLVLCQFYPSTSLQPWTDSLERVFKKYFKCCNLLFFTVL